MQDGSGRGCTVALQSVSRHHATPAGAVRALDGVIIAIEAGAGVAVTGRSGCGKSTLLGLVAALDVPTSGQVLLDGSDTSGWSERERRSWRRRHVGFLFQSDDLLPHLTGFENVLHQLALVDGDDRGGEEAAARVEALLDRLKVADAAGKLPDQLSGGQRQRVAVARALVHRPPLIVADEPTGAVDRANADAILDLLVEVQRESGATLIVVTHDGAVSERLDRRVHMADGRVVADTLGASTVGAGGAG